jgi:hypothetical protein
MDDETKKEEVVEQEETTALAELTKLTKQLQDELKNKTQEFEREKKQLIRQALDDNGKVVEVVDKSDLEAKKAGLSKKLANNNATNLEIWETSIGLRDVELELTGRDPYQPSSATDPHLGEKVALTMKELIKEANGDADKFNYLMQSKVRDNPAYTQKR